MKTCALYGLLLALAWAALTYAEYSLGYHTDPAKFAEGSLIGSIGSPVAFILFLFLGIRAYRQRRPGRSLGYGAGLLAGTGIGCFAGVFSAIWTLVYGKLINPGYHDLLREAQNAALAKMELPAESAQLAETVIRFMTSPAFLAVASLILVPILAFFVSLVLAAFLRRAPGPSSLPPPVP